MRTKKLISILLAVLLIASTCAVAVMGYDKPFKNGYSYSAKDSKGYVKMEYLHNTAVHVVNTYADNLKSSSITAILSAKTVGKTTKKVKTKYVDTRTIAAGAKSGVGASDWRSTSTNVYYVHQVSVYKPSTADSIASTITRTVG